MGNESLSRFLRRGISRRNLVHTTMAAGAVLGSGLWTPARADDDDDDDHRGRRRSEQQVYSARELDLGSYGKMFWGEGFAGDGSVVPPNHTLEITTLTVNFFPKQTGGTLGRADITGRDAPDLSTGTAKWRLQFVYVEPKKTVHLTFPKALRLEQAGGHVEIGFVEEGPGTIFVEANGVLVKH